ncbi:hypothetical protein SNE35_17960 [Paucibacter sp. R3-3]|uniref:Uncharacterized protein n=1 Tax=Roseateles agri TaxID=3098619 RepID=A0ABU5DL20_9BURK|nr:hypothetical protein [Paucibacter sp. R3-3]MDY0746403.1 hypothetical protein [Paucibacter sp. R3-3]
MITEHSSDAAKAQLILLFEELVRHDGFGDLSVEVRILKRAQKEVLIRCGKQYRYVIDVEPMQEDA